MLPAPTMIVGWTNRPCRRCRRMKAMVMARPTSTAARLSGAWTSTVEGIASKAVPATLTTSRGSAKRPTSLGAASSTEMLSRCRYSRPATRAMSDPAA